MKNGNGKMDGGGRGGKYEEEEIEERRVGDRRGKVGVKEENVKGKERREDGQRRKEEKERQKWSKR
jgi:hypothetical protein